VIVDIAYMGNLAEFTHYHQVYCMHV